MSPAPLRAAVLIGLTSLALAACGGAGEPSPATADLAARTDRVAELIEAGDDCAAEQEALELVRAADDAADSGDISADLADRVAATTQRATADLTCAPEPAPVTPADDDEDDEDDDRGKGRGKAKGEAKGHDDEDEDD